MQLSNPPVARETRAQPGRGSDASPRVDPAPAPSRRAQVARRARGEPWERSPLEWDALAPSGIYAARLRPILLYGVACVAAVPAFVLCAPLVLVNALLYGGLRNAIFVQDRVGLRGRVFAFFKLRTMREGTERDEERVTSFGRFLRNSHLDEVPQLWNVLRGDMCLIGPRPEMLSIERWAAREIPSFSRRLSLRPGITGLAQITQGYTRDGDVHAYRRKLALHRTYSRTISLRLDLVILARTVLWMLRRRGWRWRDQARSACSYRARYAESIVSNE